MSDSITTRMAEITERVDEADQSPWIPMPVLEQGKAPRWTKIYGEGMGQCEFDCWGPKAAANAVFLTNARDDMPWLIRQVQNGRRMMAAQSTVINGLVRALEEKGLGDPLAILTLFLEDYEAGKVPPAPEATDA